MSLTSHEYWCLYILSHADRNWLIDLSLETNGSSGSKNKTWPDKKTCTNTRIHKHIYIQTHVCFFLTLCRTNSHSLMFCHNLIRDHLSAYALSLSLSKPSCHFLSHRDGSSNQMETLQAKAPTYLPQFLKTKLSSEQIRCLEEVIQSQKVTN